ncbi:CxxH/CxxC protein [Kurthia huakuii]|uniref:CxxH/CxxC protein n=1 Tax=Kurthia huakuii TaxID=1421019 RepID=UPI00055A3874|nr:CxxH/CxxC protein [Kurthia huakuii]MBM7700706.1 CxxH/CxxC protein (TIGR04129 family) [Kurthia huakuii]
MKIYSCEDHVGHALDMFVANEKDFPIMDKLKESAEETQKCAYCDAKATYIVANK